MGRHTRPSVCRLHFAVCSSLHRSSFSLHPRCAFPRGRTRCTLLTRKCLKSYMLVPSNRDPHVRTVIIAPNLAIDKEARPSMPQYKYQFCQAHVPSDHRHVAVMPLQDHRIRSRSIGPAPVVGVDGGTTTLARDFSSTSATRITLHPCIAWKWRSYVPYRHIATTTLFFNPSHLHCLMIHAPPCQHRVCDAMEMVSFHHHTHAPSPRLTDERRSTFKKRGDVYW